MSVLIRTSLGDLVVDLFADRCPLTTKSFLKLCKIKYFNGCLFHTIHNSFTAQTGDPTGTSTGGDSIYKFLYGDQARFFQDEIHADLKHIKTGTVAMASAGEKNFNASQFYITLRDGIDYLDGKHTVFGEVAEGLDVLTRINEAYVDDKGRPYKNIRIKHTYILDDPFDDPPELAELIPDASPEGKPKDEVDDDDRVRLEDDWVPMDEKLGPVELEEVIRAKEARSSAKVLEIIEDIPDAEIKSPENVLFVCKLNPVTQDDDLSTIFSQFGNVVSAEVIRDFKTGDSLSYAFIEFESKEACEKAYFKMDNALIDDRRIHVDFSQSVAKIWSQYRRKEHQRGNGKGCFKCGDFDHLAKDCTEVSGKIQSSTRYTMKNSNTQCGGDLSSKYEMVFEEHNPPSSKRGKKHHQEKQRMEKQDMEDSKQKDQGKRDTSHDEKMRGDGSLGSTRDGSTRNEHFYGGSTARSKDIDNRHGGFQGDRGERHHRKTEHQEERSNGQDYNKTDNHGDRRNKTYYSRNGGQDSYGDQRQDRDSKKRSANADHHSHSVFTCTM